jgi:hypothetical protein
MACLKMTCSFSGYGGPARLKPSQRGEEFNGHSRLGPLERWASLGLRKI